MQEVRDHLCTGFSFLHHVLCTTDDVIKGPVDMEKTCLGYVEGSLACPSYRGKSQLLILISLQNVTNLHEEQNVDSAFSMAWSPA